MTTSDSWKPNPKPNALSTASLDRVNQHRKNPAWLAEQWATSSTQVHVVWQGHVAANGANLAPLSPAAASKLLGDDYPRLLLGVIDDTAHFGVEVSQLDRAALENALHEDAMLRNVREAAGTLCADASNLAAMASALMIWHGKNKFCSGCGQPNVLQSAGHELHCNACNTTHFPRTDPALIMLVTNGNKAILGRQKIWPAGMFSTLAGFLEPGESLEDTVAREVFEEVGVRVTSVKYSSSQPWPFPQSLMVGYHATTDDTELNVDTNELETAEFFTKDDLLEARAMGKRGYPSFPPSIAISRRLIDEWLDS
jgi:NAD+ diphosphatase